MVPVLEHAFESSTSSDRVEIMHSTPTLFGDMDATLANTSIRCHLKRNGVGQLPDLGLCTKTQDIFGPVGSQSLTFLPFLVVFQALARYGANLAP
jgi:hypothetical protein